METLRLVAPSPSLGDGLVSLSPITLADLDEIVAIGDSQGFMPLFDPSLLDSPFDANERLRLWVGKRAALWNSIELPVTMQDACFAVKEAETSRVIGLVGFNRPHSSPFSNQLNVYYWTAPAMRGHGIAVKAVLAGLPWARATFRVSDAIIRAANQGSERVAKKAGFFRADGMIDGAPVFKLPA
jgi:RimJ/RimL family protein N-acetyltransferase